MRTPVHSVTLVREFEAPVETLYAAWTDLDFMRRWFGSVVEGEVRVGGRYRVENHEPEAAYAHTGEFLLLEPPHRVVMSFRFDGPGADDYEDEFVQVVLKTLGPNLTELTLTNGWGGKGMSEEDFEALRKGWTDWLDRLEKAL